MHERNRSGELRGTTNQLARLARCSTVELESALTELQTSEAAVVEYRNDSWLIANRRMQREAVTREKRQLAGSYGGSKTQANREQIPEYESEDEGLGKVREFARGEGISQRDADWFFWKCHGNGWKNNGKPILDWRATLRSWQRAGYLPSQKNGAHPSLPLREAKPKDNRDIPDKMKSWLIEKDPSTRDKWENWKTMGDVPQALRGMWFAHIKNEKEHRTT